MVVMSDVEVGWVQFAEQTRMFHDTGADGDQKCGINHEKKNTNTYTHSLLNITTTVRTTACLLLQTPCLL